MRASRWHSGRRYEPEFAVHVLCVPQGELAMKLRSFVLVLLAGLSVSMSTKLAVSSALDYWRSTKQLTHYEALCAARGGTAVLTDGGFRCLTCDGS